MVLYYVTDFEAHVTWPPQVSRNAELQCHENLTPESVYDDLRLASGADTPRKPGTKHTYCIVAASTIGAGAQPYMSNKICKKDFQISFEVQIVGKMLTKDAKLPVKA